jgi:ATP-dependent DNA helicase RecQ
MDSIAFIDSEIEYKTNRILDLGGVKSTGSQFHSNSVSGFVAFLKDVKWVCGHNILKHDLKFIGPAIRDAGVPSGNIIDTLFLSPLLFPKKPYHKLVKDEKLNYDDVNDPLNDSIKTKDLFHDEVTAYNEKEASLKQIFFQLLHREIEFAGFFSFIGLQAGDHNLKQTIRRKFDNQICSNADLDQLISESPRELAYALALIESDDKYSITPPWILKSFPLVHNVMLALRSKACLTGCSYCNQALDVHKGLKRFFGFDKFRTYDGQPLQESAAKAAVDNKSLLAIFPTGGGKSLTFQLPALMSGENMKALTVVISPLQSLMKDQVDNLVRLDIIDAVTINGLLDPIERADSFERVRNGSASILYISPESLRSATIEKLILSRNVARFVIDEAHCFSAWGQDFRVDYLYIADFIKSIQEKKNLSEPIPVSCFTATAKRKVIEDIRSYFSTRLQLDLEVFQSTATRTNLKYQIFERTNEDEKYDTLRDLIQEKDCPTIVYVSRTHRANTIAEKLVKDGFNARPFHGKMDAKEKTANQDAFVKGEAQVMVATSAFGMGVDKKDIGMVVHYEISDSLENYIQEAGRAGRDDNISADCYVLFNEEDLGKHFILLNQSKLSIKEIQQVWKAIKDITRFRMTASNSALEIARKAGWDDNILQIETRVTTAIAALEEAGYLRRGQNLPRIFATSILARTAQEAIDKIVASPKFDESQAEKAVRIIKKLFASKSRKHQSDEVAESRVDYISDHLGIVREEVISVINLLRDEKILADQKDLTAFINKADSENRSLSMLTAFCEIEKCFLARIHEAGETFSLKELNEEFESHGCEGVNPNRIKTVINFWAIKNWIQRQNQGFSRNHVHVTSKLDKAILRNALEKRHDLARFIVRFLYEKSNHGDGTQNKQEQLVDFSVHELKTEYDRSNDLFKKQIDLNDVEDSLLYLSRIDALKIEGGFLVIYNKLSIERLEQNNKVQYKREDYEKLHDFYENKVQQIHIVGEYARKMISDYKGALQFVDDYFQLNYSSFLNRYFPGSRQNDIKRNLTPAKFRQLFGALSPTQLEIIKDKEKQYIVIIAGPGSGKTRVLVHKLASLILMEDVKYDQLLMLTFSRAAATEFKKRLMALIGNAAHFVEIKTFHSYCFDLLGRVGSLEKSDAILSAAVNRIVNGEVDSSRITKAVLVIDEAQDMDENEFALINALIEHNVELRVVAVGDDDQNVYGFRGSDSKYMHQLISTRNAFKYELTENYRSKANLIAFSNQFVHRIRNRLKVNPITAKRFENGGIRIVRHKGVNLIVPIVTEIINTGLMGSTCVLTRKNEEASLITGLLIREGLKAKLIQSNDGFNVYNLFEVRYFLDEVATEGEVSVISEEKWTEAKRRLAKQFKSSTALELVKTLIADFEVANPKRKYTSDLESFIRESKLEDCYPPDSEVVFVSTMHKAKGREFENVFIMLDGFDLRRDEDARTLYVAITRAKDNLTIHTNGSQFDGIRVEGLTRHNDDSIYSLPNELTVQLTLKDVVLDYFISRQHLYSELMSGLRLAVRTDGCCNSRGEYLLKFSAKCKESIAAQEQKGYLLKGAVINFVVYWRKEGQEQEYKVLIPELHFVKSRS